MTNDQGPRTNDQRPTTRCTIFRLVNSMCCCSPISPDEWVLCGAVPLRIATAAITKWNNIKNKYCDLVVGRSVPLYFGNSFPRYIVSPPPRYFCTSLPLYLDTSSPPCLFTSVPHYLVTSLPRYLVSTRGPEDQRARRPYD